MARQILLRSPPVNHRKQQPLLMETQIDDSPKMKPLPRKHHGVGEVAGGTAAECAAVCCCCPCTVINLAILAVYKLPAGICKKVTQRRRRKRKQQGLLLRKAESGVSQGGEDDEVERELRAVIERGGKSGDAVELEEDLWERFYSTGFWRSPSQVEPAGLASAGKSVHMGS